jgi:hypothetical protein
VLLPRYGQAARRVNVYIGTENTYTVERFENGAGQGGGDARASRFGVRTGDDQAMRAAGRELRASLR